MKAICFTILLSVISLTQTRAQGTWVQKNSLHPGCYAQSVAFCVIGSKAYMGMGTAYCFDWWEYDPVADAYTQKANFPDTASNAVPCFAFGGYGYVLSNGNRLWKYDPLNDTWSDTGDDFPGISVQAPYFFTIGSKAYVAGGYDPVQWSTIKDFWEYNFNTGQWTRLPDLPVANGGGEAFSVGGKGYLTGGRGSGNNWYATSVFEYDPVTAVWNTKNNFPDGRFLASSFVLGNDAYVGMGIVRDDNGNLPFNIVYRYDPVADSWTRVADIPHVGIYDEGVGFAINGKGYMGLGDCNVIIPPDCVGGYMKLLFEYTPPNFNIKENEAEQFSLYPNPTQGKLTLSPVNGQHPFSTVEVLTMTGERVQGMTISGEPGPVEIDLSEYPGGVYIIQADDGVRICNRKVIVQ